jgi:hypothetical protein
MFPRTRAAFRGGMAARRLLTKTDDAGTARWNTGGAARLDARRPRKLRWWTYLLSVGAIAFVLWITILAALNDSLAPPWAEFSLAFVAGSGNWLRMRRAREPIRPDVVSFVRHSYTTSSGFRVFLSGCAVTLIVRLLADGLGWEWLVTAGELLFIPIYLWALYVAFTLTGGFITQRRRQYEMVRDWGNPETGYLKSILGFAITSRETDRIVQFTCDPVTGEQHVTVSPVPPGAALRLHNAEVTMARSRIDAWMIDESAETDSIRFVPISDERLQQRETLRSSNYTLLGFDENPVPDDEVVGRKLILDPEILATDASAPPPPQAAPVAVGVTERDLAQIQRFATDSGLTIVGYDFNQFRPEGNRFENRVFVQRVTEKERQILDSVAKLLNANPWEFWMEFHWIDRQEHGRRIDTVVVKRHPVSGLTADARQKFWLAVVEVMPDGGNGWVVDDGQADQLVTLKYGDPLVVPFPAPAYIPDVIDGDKWNHLPLGLGVDGCIVGINLAAGPHTLIAGPTGSGKTIALTQLAISGLAHGHQLVMIDPVKSGLDFLNLREYCSGWGDTYQASSELIQRIYAEVPRRKAVLLKYGKRSWHLLPREIREAEDVHPLLVVIDEYMSLSIQTKLPSGIDKESTFAINTMALNEAKALITLTVGTIAREARFVGIHLAVALQRPDTAAIPGFGEVRSNMTHRLQLFSPTFIPPAITLAMMFESDAVPEVQRLARALSDGISPGLAITLEDGKGPQALRIGFADPEAQSTSDRIQYLNPKVGTALTMGGVVTSNNGKGSSMDAGSVSSPLSTRHLMSSAE